MRESINIMRRVFKLFYFVQYLPVGIFGPYFALYLYDSEFTGSQIGLLLGSMPIVVMLIQPVWGYLSDFFNTRRTILLISYSVMGVCMLGIGYARSFTAVWILVLFFAAFNATIQPIGNAILLDYLERNGKADDFGLFRLWGSTAFSISSLILGVFFLDRFLDFFTKILAGLYFLNGLVSYLLPEQGKKFTYRALDALKFLPNNPNFAIYLLGSIFIGASLSISISYLTIFLNALNTPNWLVGVTISLQAILEIPLMMLAPLLVNRFSWRKVILIGAIALPIRWVLFLLIQNPGWIVPTQILHSLAIVSFMVVGVSFIDKRINQKWRATSQGLYSSAMGGLGSGLGLLFSGYVLDRYSVRAIWVLNLFLGAIGLIFISIALNRFQKVTEKAEVITNPCQTM